jgi:hypothetical protein
LWRNDTSVAGDERDLLHHDVSKPERLLSDVG